MLKRFQALSPDSALRLVSQTPSDLPTFFGPILPSQFLEEAELLALELTLAMPAKAHLIVAASDFVLASAAPKVEQQNENLDLRFDIPEGAARLLLQRLARVQPPAKP